MPHNASNWANYLREREGKFVLERSEGFAIYTFIEKYCYIEDIYVAPEFRGSNVLPELMQEITTLALSKGYKWLLGSVDTKDKRASQNMAIHLHYGFKVLHNDSSLTYFQLEISPTTVFSRKEQ